MIDEIIVCILDRIGFAGTFNCPDTEVKLVELLEEYETELTMSPDALSSFMAELYLIYEADIVGGDYHG